MINDLILRVKKNNVTYDLDINSDIPLRIDMSAVENQEIGGVFGIGSQQFNLPGTKTNNKFFNHAYDVSQQDIPAFYSTIPAWIILNGETLLEGSLQLQEVVTDDDGYVTYNVMINDNVVDFSANLGDKLVKDANFSAYDHTLTSGSIIDSWTTDISGAVFYPLADYGVDEYSSFPQTPLVTITGNSNLSGSIDNVITPMPVYQFLPAIKANKVIEAICAQANYTYSSSFLDSSDFNNIYMLTKAKEELGIVGDPQENVLNVTMSANFSRTYTNTPPASYGNIMAFDNEISDPGNNYNITTYEYTAPYDGYYFVDLALSMSYATPERNAGPMSLQLFDSSSTAIVASASLDMEDIYLFPNEEQFTLRLQDRVGLVKGHKYYVLLSLDVQAQDDPPYDNFTITVDRNNSWFRIPRALSIYDDSNVNMALQFDSELKSIDVFKGFLEHFNLVAYPNPESEKELIIEQFDEWVRDGEIKDWTDKY